MAKIITFLSNQKQCGKTTIAFNFANILSHQNKKILLVNLELDPTKFLKCFSKLPKIKNINQYFSCLTYAKHYQIMFITNHASIHKTAPTMIDYQKSLIKQIRAWSKLFDVIILDGNSIWKSLNISLFNLTDYCFMIYNPNNFVIADITNTLHELRVAHTDNKKSKIICAVCNMFDQNNNHHVANLLQLKKIFTAPNNLFLLPVNESLSKISDRTFSYAQDEAWSDYAIKLNQILKSYRF